MKFLQIFTVLAVFFGGNLWGTVALSEEKASQSSGVVCDKDGCGICSDEGCVNIGDSECKDDVCEPANVCADGEYGSYPDCKSCGNGYTSSAPVNKPSSLCFTGCGKNTCVDVSSDTYTSGGSYGKPNGVAVTKFDSGYSHTLFNVPGLTCDNIGTYCPQLVVCDGDATSACKLSYKTVRFVDTQNANAQIGNDMYIIFDSVWASQPPVASSSGGNAYAGVYPAFTAPTAPSYTNKQFIGYSSDFEGKNFVIGGTSGKSGEASQHKSDAALNATNAGTVSGASTDSVVTLYAQYEEIETSTCVTISFDDLDSKVSDITSANNPQLYKLTNDPTGKWFSDSDCKKEITSPVKLNGAPKHPRAFFAGYTRGDGTTYTIFDTSPTEVISSNYVWQVSEDATLYAQYVCNQGYSGAPACEDIVKTKVVYKCDNGSNTFYSDEDIAFNSSYTTLDDTDGTITNNCGASHDMSKFNGWMTYTVPVSQYSSAPNTYGAGKTIANWPYAQTVIFVAKWNTGNSYTVRCRNGKGVYVQFASVYSDGETFSVDGKSLKKQCNSSCTEGNLTGWDVFLGDPESQYAVATLTNDPISIEFGTTPYTDTPVTLRAHCEKPVTSNIIYHNIPDALAAANSYLPTTYTMGKTMNIPAGTGNSSEMFIEWCTDAAMTNCAPTQTIPATAYGDQEFWGRWDKAPETFTVRCLNANDGYNQLDSLAYGDIFDTSVSGMTDALKCFGGCDKGEHREGWDVFLGNPIGSSPVTVLPGDYFSFNVGIAPYTDATITLHPHCVKDPEDKYIVECLRKTDGSYVTYGEYTDGATFSETDKNLANKCYDGCDKGEYYRDGWDIYVLTEDGTESWVATQSDDTISFKVGDGVYSTTPIRLRPHCVKGTTTNTYTVRCPIEVKYETFKELGVFNDGGQFSYNDQELGKTCSVNCGKDEHREGWNVFFGDPEYSSGTTVYGDVISFILGISPFTDSMITLRANCVKDVTSTINYYNVPESLKNYNGHLPTSYTPGIAMDVPAGAGNEQYAFVAWCTDEAMTNCAYTQTIPATASGDQNFWAQWECRAPYMMIGGQCTSCADDEYYNSTTKKCEKCGDNKTLGELGFKNSIAPYNWSINQCFRRCTSYCDSNEPSFNGNGAYSTALFGDGKNQIEFYGNYVDGIDTCGKVKFCPRVIIGDKSGIEDVTAVPVDFFDPDDAANEIAEYYIVGRAINTSTPWDVSPAMAWSQIAGLGQQYNIDGQFYSLPIYYPVKEAPNAGYAESLFLGYVNPKGNDHIYVKDGLGYMEANDILGHIVGNSANARPLYAKRSVNNWDINYECDNYGTPVKLSDHVTYQTQFNVTTVNLCNMDGSYDWRLFDCNEFETQCTLLDSVFAPGQSYNWWTIPQNDHFVLVAVDNKNVGAIYLDNAMATTVGTERIYGNTVTQTMYLDILQQYSMSPAGSTEINPITLPKREYLITLDANGGNVGQSNILFSYEFNGYIDSTGSTLIDNRGYITDAGIAAGMNSGNWWNAMWNKSPITLPTPTWNGHAFLGWYDKKDDKIVDMYSYNTEGDVTLIAQWEKIGGGCHKVSFNDFPAPYGTASGITGANNPDLFKLDGDSAWYKDSKCSTKIDYSPISVAKPSKENAQFAGYVAPSYNLIFTPAGVENDPQWVIYEDTTLNAQFDCKFPYHEDPTTHACGSCPAGHFWDAGINKCLSCSDYTGKMGNGQVFPLSMPPFNHSVDQCYRECPAGTYWGDNGMSCKASGISFYDTTQVNFENFSGSTNKQVEFWGNRNEAVNACEKVENVNCPRGILWNSNQALYDIAYKTLTAPVTFWYPNTQDQKDDRFIIGLEQGTNYTAQAQPASLSPKRDGSTYDMSSVDPDSASFEKQNARGFGSRSLTTDGDYLWSLLMGPAQHDAKGHAFITYPAYSAPNAEVGGLVFLGYRNPNDDHGTTFVESNYALTSNNAASILRNISSVVDDPRNVWAFYDGGNNHSVTYTANGGVGANVIQNAIYQSQFTTYGLGETGFTKPGHRLAGWVHNKYNQLSYQYESYDINGDLTLPAKWCNEEHYGTYGIDCTPCPEGWTSPAGSISNKQCTIPYGETIPCSAPHAVSALRTWSVKANAYSSCQIVQCELDYHIESNACVPDVKPCALKQGRGEQHWNGSEYGACEPIECNPGFEEIKGECVECDNKYVSFDNNLDLAVSSYASGCQIAACMHQGQKYALDVEQNVCKPICEKDTDETGSRYWEEGKQRCVRKCNPGYLMW